MEGYRYGLLLFNVASRYFWFYVLKSTTSNEIINALYQLRADARHLPRQFHADFDRKLMGGKCIRRINNNNSKIIVAPAKRRSANGPVKRTWRNLVQMARTYLTKKQMPR